MEIIPPLILVFIGFIGGFSVCFYLFPNKDHIREHIENSKVIDHRDKQRLLVELESKI